MDSATASAQTDPQKPVETPKRLILCFDGTGNAFKGNPGDTNIVKLYNMFDRADDLQMHYYQPGIGTYPAEGPVNVTWFRTLVRKVEAVIDTALATSFDSHVIAGYKFVMRHYRSGDRIYIFGFSRGAYTARFLARMISKVGLLSVGNDELVPFAYKVYQEFEQNGSGIKLEQKGGGIGREQNGIGTGRKPNDTENEREVYMDSFKQYFCRTEKGNSEGIKVHFLGLFDCVSSVGNLDVPFFQKAPPLPEASGTAKHVRHAVAVDERRVKFKAALFAQEKPKDNEDIKEVWFPGNHGDVGGGWDPERSEHQCEHPSYDLEKDHFQLSDIALKWMINELDNVEKRKAAEGNSLTWSDKRKSFLDRFKHHKKQMLDAPIHDTMTFGGGSKNKLMIVLWNIMEYIPWIIKRWELIEKPLNNKLTKYEWEYTGWPPNKGGRRDIPSTALLHSTVKHRLEQTDYNPTNSLWVKADGSSGLDPKLTNMTELAPSARQEKGASWWWQRWWQKPGPLLKIQFEHHSTGSVLAQDLDSAEEEENLDSAEEEKNWDKIYRVVKPAEYERSG